MDIKRTSIDMIIKYTSEIAPEMTIAEIRKCLARLGASAIVTNYDKETGKATGLIFKMRLGDISLSFRLPLDWRPVYVILTSGLKFNSRDEERNVERKNRYRERAERTPWRIAKDWIDAQMALVETKMITAP
jgi:hypothetical protein